jgi:hypothetical protein
MPDYADDDFLVVARFRDGSVLRRYFKAGEYWHEWPQAMMVSAERLSMKRAADRVVWRGAEIVPGISGLNQFYNEIKRIRTEWADELVKRGLG